MNLDNLNFYVLIVSCETVLCETIKEKIMGKFNCEGRQFSFDFFREKVKNVHKKLDLSEFNEDYIVAAKLNVEVAKKMNEFNEKFMAKDGFVGQTWIILMIICSTEEDLCAMDLCEALGQSKATVSRIIESLKEKSFVEEVENKTDRRKYNLNITPKGTDYIKEKMIEHRKFYNTIFQDINTAILIPEMLSVLNKINNYQGNSNEN